MVAKEFLEELERIRLDFEWRFDGRNRKVRAEVQSETVLFDPIGALCFAKTGLVFDEELWFRAACELGLSHIDAGDLMAAANNVCAQANRAYLHHLRRQLIDHIRLQPERVPGGFHLMDGLLVCVSTVFGRHAHSR